MKQEEFFWTLYTISLLILAQLNRTTTSGGSIPGVVVQMPPSHVALSGDFHVHIVSSSFPPLLLQLSRLEGDLPEVLATVNVYPEARALSLNKTIVKINCGYFSRGGQYYVVVKSQETNKMGETTGDTNNSSEDVDILRTITKPLDVRWPMPQLTLTPEYVQTYPERPVEAILQFPEAKCSPAPETSATALPEFWLELFYCGHSIIECGKEKYEGNQTQALYTEKITGLPIRHIITLRCELFGIAGHYAFFLRPTKNMPSLPSAETFLQADWSDQFVFNVHARSILPCEGHSYGVRVLFEYPSCILENGDRIRLYGRLRANVTSLNPPTSLVYIGEKWIKRNEHRIDFSCDLFTEKYVEYCFVYVSQAITGAVSDVRMDCVPTHPVSEHESGGWGPWSPWTQCTSTCNGGVRSRYRFCDNPPPRYGAKFCEGRRVETEKCYLDSKDAVECWYGDIKGDIPDIPQIEEEVGSYCRCGCIVHLGKAKKRRYLEASAQSCPGRNFWQIQADENCIIELRIEHIRLLCNSQWLKVRDGVSLSSNLMAYLTDANSFQTTAVNSSGPNILLEFNSEEKTWDGTACEGRFLAQAIQVESSQLNHSNSAIAQHIGLLPFSLKLTAVHIAAIFILSVLLVATFLLAIQYTVRYRKYQIAKSDDLDSLTDPSVSAINLQASGKVPSSTTLISEVISLTRLRSAMTSKHKHSRLRESMDGENYQETGVTLAKEEESLSDSSTTTLANLDTTTSCLPQTTTTSEMEEVTMSLPVSPNLEENRTLTRSSTITIKSSSEKDDTKEKEQKPAARVEKLKSIRRLSNVSASGLTKVSVDIKTLSKSDPGCYSPALSNISRAKIRHTNEKESKEKQNREKLLAGPLGSEFSIAGQETDLELDYYDYNVTNAGAAPGSYLGMDPAFLVWIPPLDDSGEILKDLDKITVKNKIYLDPGSNQESPDSTEPSVILRRKPNLNIMAPVHTANIKNDKHVDSNILQDSPKKDGNKSKGSSFSKEAPQFIEMTSLKKQCNSDEDPLVIGQKETKMEKFIHADSNILNDIKFADDD